ncbi:MAG TPA: hypothetical protein VGI72_04040 [Gaiellales bacterium]|jgi:hypothetical protein
MSRIGSTAAALLAAVLLAAPAAASTRLVQTPLKTKPAPVNEESPSAAPGEFAWVQNSRMHPHLYEVYAQNGGGTRFRVNPAGTQGGLGTGIDGHTLVYTQLHGTRSSIRMFNLQTRTGSAPPAGVNTPSVEDEPSLSGNWLLYHRLEDGASPGQQILLTNLTTGATRTLASVPGARGFLEAGQVNGNFAVFTQSQDSSRFNVWVYDIAAKTLTVVPNPQDKLHSAPAVNPQGTVYFEESGQGCGSHVTVAFYPVGGPVISVGTLNPGIDLFHPFLFESGTGDHYQFAKIRCTGGATDIYEATFL